MRKLQIDFFPFRYVDLFKVHMHVYNAAADHTSLSSYKEVIYYFFFFQIIITHRFIIIDHRKEAGTNAATRVICNATGRRKFVSLLLQLRMPLPLQLQRCIISIRKKETLYLILREMQSRQEPLLGIPQ